MRKLKDIVVSKIEDAFTKGFDMNQDLVEDKKGIITVVPVDDAIEIIPDNSDVIRHPVYQWTPQQRLNDLKKQNYLWINPRIIDILPIMDEKFTFDPRLLKEWDFKINTYRYIAELFRYSSRIFAVLGYGIFVPLAFQQSIPDGAAMLGILSVTFFYAVAQVFRHFYLSVFVSYYKKLRTMMEKMDYTKHLSMTENERFRELSYYYDDLGFPNIRDKDEALKAFKMFQIGAYEERHDSQAFSWATIAITSVVLLFCYTVSDTLASYAELMHTFRYLWGVSFLLCIYVLVVSLYNNSIIKKSVVELYDFEINPDKYNKVTVEEVSERTSKKIVEPMRKFDWKDR